MANYIQNYNGGVQFKTGASQGLTVDINGNIGVGTTPSTWTDNYKSIDLSGNGGIASTTAGYFQLANNAYVNSGEWKYKATGYSTLIQQTPTGAIQFQVATSGTTNTNITWNTAMTLDASGRLGVGTSNTSAFRLNTSGKGTTGNVWGDNLVQFVDSTPNETGLRIAVNASTSGLTQLVASTNSAASQFGFWTYNGTSWGERARIDSNGNVGIGTPLNTWESRSRVIQTGFNNKAGYVIENFTSGNSADSNPVNTGVGFYRNTSNVFSYINSFTKPLLFSMFNGAYSWLTAPAGASDTPITWTNALTLDASGNLLLTSGTGALGYGTGAGGTVTQLTSKSTAVTLNKPTGKITMTADALAAGASVTFLVNNSILTATDIVYPAIIGGIADATAYRLELVASISGMCRFRLTNLSAGSLSEAVVIQFALIKGAIA